HARQSGRGRVHSLRFGVAARRLVAPARASRLRRSAGRLQSRLHLPDRRRANGAHAITRRLTAHAPQYPTRSQNRTCIHSSIFLSLRPTILFNTTNAWINPPPDEITQPDSRIQG